MAYRPSYRRSGKRMENLEPNLTPVMNLMVVMIPLLLSSAQFIKLSVIELNLPPATGAAQVEEPKETELKLDLAVTITDKGFFLSSAAAIMRTEKGPSIPKLNGNYDFDQLSQKLYEIKQKATGRFTDTESIIIQAEPLVDYQSLVSTMDASRSIKVEGKEIRLFPRLALSVAVL